ncbi:hypothetical protein BASA60_001915 [Batrachochytrium salamandrivorans]|nr:hypothetical protein BASA60_001915 [Batrachochytrium salamandrivorans]
MRVHIGISLSVLSLSVLAKVIPNDGSHGSLLSYGLTRAGVAEAGASASSDDSSPNQPSGSGELNKVSQTPDSTEEPRWLFQEQLLPHRSKHILDSDERLIQKAIEKVTGAFEGPTSAQLYLIPVLYLLYDLFSKMDTTENRAYVEVTKDYIRQMDSDWDLALELLEKIKGMVNDGMMRLKPVPSRFSSLTSSVKKRLGIKDGPPVDTTTD